MYTDYMEALQDLTDAQAGQFLISCIKYAIDEKMPLIEDPAVRIAFKMAKPRMDRDAQKWQETVEKRKEAGRKGGQATQSKRKQMQANASKDKKTQANQAVNECVNDCVYVNNKKHCTFSNAQIDEIFERVWKAYPEKKGKSRVSLADKKKIAEIGAAQMIEAINLYMRDMKQTPWKHYQHGSTFFHGGYIDYLPENYEESNARGRPAARFNNGTSRSYNMADLEKKLLASN